MLQCNNKETLKVERKRKEDGNDAYRTRSGVAHPRRDRPSDHQGAGGNLRRALRNYKTYRRTLAELRELPTDTLLDLDLYRGDLKRIARQAVWRT